MLSISPDVPLTEVKVGGKSVMIDKNYYFYYPLKLDPFGYRLKGDISVIFEKQTQKVYEMLFHVPIDPFLLITPVLAKITMYQDISDAITDYPACIRNLDFSKCKFLEFSGNMARFSETQYIQYCRAKYNKLYQLGYGSLGSIFFLLQQQKIMGKDATIGAPSNQPLVSVRQAKSKAGPMDRFLHKK